MTVIGRALGKAFVEHLLRVLLIEVRVARAGCSSWVAITDQRLYVVYDLLGLSTHGHQVR